MTSYALSSAGNKNPVFYQTPDGGKLTTQDQVVVYLSKQETTKYWKLKQNLDTAFIFVPIGTDPDVIRTKGIAKKCRNAKVVTLNSVLDVSNHSEVYSFRIQDQNYNYIIAHCELPISEHSFFYESKDQQTDLSYSITFGVWDLSKRNTLLFRIPLPDVRQVFAIDVCRETNAVMIRKSSIIFKGIYFQMMVEYQTNPNQQVTALRYSITWVPGRYPDPINKRPKFRITTKKNDEVDLTIYCYNNKEIEFHSWFPYLIEMGPVIDSFPSQTTITIPLKYRKEAINTLEKRGYQNSSR